jgi:hypothetical protein
MQASSDQFDSPTPHEMGAQPVPGVRLAYPPCLMRRRLGKRVCKTASISAVKDRGLEGRFVFLAFPIPIQGGIPRNWIWNDSSGKESEVAKDTSVEVLTEAYKV